MSALDYATLFGAVLDQGVVRDRDAGHPGILIWGTLEARVGGADLVILGGMNDGTWPEAPSPDPWLNRQMRLAAGLLLPDRRIGLSAHDYQQAVTAPEVWITRSKRSADAETVPSRWVNRLTFLLDGLAGQNGPAALAAMRARGNDWIARADALGRPASETPKAHRPSPRPPVEDRPTEISVTEVKRLVRDPYAIYARRILGLERLDPLVPDANAPLKGTIYHAALERFMADRPEPGDPAAYDRLIAITSEELEKDCPWPLVRLHWLTEMERIAPDFLKAETSRLATTDALILERKVRQAVAATGVDLVCKADRIDLSAEGTATVYDYKTGAIPTKKQQLYFDKQLLLTAALVEQGAFTGAPQPVTGAGYIAISTTNSDTPAPLDEAPPSKVWLELATLLQSWQDKGRGYTARMALARREDSSDYDHLSRFGEWTISDPPEPEDVG